MKSIESTQYNAARAVTGAWKGTNKDKLYAELGWESLSDRRWSRRLVQFYKNFNDFTPQYLNNFVPPTRALLYGRRRENVLHEFKCRTETFANTFFPDSVKIWNNIGIELRSIDTLSEFKKQIIKLVRPSTYGIHRPLGIKRLFQLRLGLSHLNPIILGSRLPPILLGRGNISPLI